MHPLTHGHGRRSGTHRPHTHRPHTHRPHTHGQALVESLFTLPVLMLLLLAIFLIGALFYAGQASVGAMRRPITLRLELANTPGAISPAQLSSRMNDTPNGSLNMAGIGAPIDYVTLNAGANSVIAYMVGQKATNFGYAFFPAVTFRLAQGMDASLLAANLGSPAFSKTTQSIALALPAPGEYGFDPASPIWQSTQVAINLTCSPSGTLSLDMLNQVLGSDYPLTDFPVPTTSAAVGAPQFAATYPSFDTLNSFSSLENTACDAPASLQTWQTTCQGQAFAAATVAAQTQYNTDKAAYDATLAAAAAAAPPPAVDPANPVVPPPPAFPAFAYDPATDPAAAAQASSCVLAKQRGCRVGYANQYVTQLVQRLSTTGQCQAIGNGSDVTFTPPTLYRYGL